MPPIKRRESPVRRVNPSGKEVWKARYTTIDSDGREHRPSAGTFKLKRDAQAAIDAAYQTPLAPSIPDTVGAYLPIWLAEHPVSERTTKTNRGRINAVLDVELEGVLLRDWPMGDLGRRQAKALVAHMLTEQHRAPEGVRNILRALSAMAEDAFGDGLADGNPWRGVKVRDDDKRALKQSREPRVLSWDEMHAFAAAAGVHEPMIRMLGDCGLRIGELFALARARQDLKAGIFCVDGSAWEGVIVGSSAEKRHDRIGPIPAGCLALLRQTPVRIDSPWLHPTKSGKLWRINNFYRDVWNPARRESGIDATPQDFRHSWVTNLRGARIDPADLADVAGHSEQTATAHYTHALRRSFDAIREAIG